VALRGGGGPDWMVAGFGSLWVRQDNAVVNRLAPDGMVQATIDAGIFEQPVCQGLGISDVAVWACATEGKLMRINPRTNKVAAIVELPKVNEQGRLVAYDDHIWVLTGDGDQLVGVSERTNKPGQPIDLGAYCTDVADEVLGSTLWIVCPYDGAVLRVDLQTREVTGRVEGLPNANAVAAGHEVWVCTDDGIAHVDASSLSAKAIQPATGGLFCGLRLSGDILWVRTPTSFLTGIDTSSGEVAEVITAPGPPSGGDVVEFDNALWVSAFDRGLVFKLNYTHD
jgi:ligand-binding sensor domain-containing protein